MDMSKWEEKKLKELGTIITGNTPPTSNRGFYGDAYKFIKPTDITENLRYVPTTEEKYSELGYEKYKQYFLPVNTPCVVTIGSLGKKICLTDEPSFTNQAINAIIPFEENDGRFIYYLMKVMLPAVKHLSSGTASGRENVSKSSFSNIKVKVPSLQVQLKIADILSSYDDLIENNNRRIEILEKVSQEVYKEWFIRMRFPNYKITKMENGIPQGWEIVKVKDIVKRFPYGKIYKASDCSDTGNIIVIDQSRKDYLGFHYDEPSHTASIENPIILFGDHTCKMKLMITPFSLAENVIPFISKTDIPITFLYFLVNSLVTTSEYKRHWGELTSKKVLLPIKKLQKEFHYKVKENQLLINTLQEQNRNLIKQRDMLLLRLMSGKLEVK
jgi:type I restriction enzyme, S subunit